MRCLKCRSIGGIKLSKTRAFSWTSWAVKLNSLAWGAEELFGLHELAPMARYDQMGLIWLLKGEHVVALTATGRGCQAG
jgi:hypothetical protein